MKHHLARICEAMAFESSKSHIFEQSTVYQIGGQSGHSPEEHKSLMGLMEYMGEGLILNLVDIIAFFDREEILDVIEALEDMEVNKKVIRLLYKLNEKTEIKVKTSVILSLPRWACWSARARARRLSGPRPWLTGP